MNIVTDNGLPAKAMGQPVWRRRKQRGKPCAVFSAAARGRMRWSTWRGLGWEGDLAAMREGGRGPAPVIVVDSWVWIDSGTTTGIST